MTVIILTLTPAHQTDRAEGSLSHARMKETVYASINVCMFVHWSIAQARKHDEFLNLQPLNSRMLTLTICFDPYMQMFISAW